MIYSASFKLENKVFNVLQSSSAVHESLSHALFPSVAAFQRQRRDELCLIPMRYGDSLTEPLPSSHTSEPQTCPATNPRDSESYGSLHGDDESESEVLGRLKLADEFGQTEMKFTGKNTDGLDSDSHVDTGEQQLITGAVETNNQNKHTRTRFCVIL